MTTRNHEYDPQVINMLSDENLMPLFCAAGSHKTKVSKIQAKLKRDLVELTDQQISQILSIVLDSIISPGLKGTVRGNTFNNIVFQQIGEIVQELKIDVIVEREIKLCMDEKVDWSIKYKDHYLAGYNQIDLWGGGAQKNRYNKYTDSDYQSKCKVGNVTLICVVAKQYIPPKRITRSAEKMIEMFNSDIIIYTGGLKRVISAWINQLISN